MEEIKLEESDVQSLEGNNYMSERVIEYYFAYLRNKFPSQNMLLIPPSVSVLMLMETDDDLMLVLKNYELIIFPIRCSETYVLKNLWSLVVFHRLWPASGKYYSYVHYDFCRGAHRELANHYYELLEEHIGYNGHFGKYNIYADTKPTAQFLCGDYVLAVVELICNWYDESKRRKGFTGQYFWYQEYVTMMRNPNACFEKRNQIQEMVVQARVAYTSVKRRSTRL